MVFDGILRDLSLTNPTESTFLLVFFFILLILYKVALQKTILKENNAVSAIIAVSLALLSVYYMSEYQKEFIQNMYGMMGTAILGILALLLILTFFHTIFPKKQFALYRKLFVGAAGIVVYILSRENITFSKDAMIIYFVMLGALLLLDNQINIFFRKRRIRKRRSE